jgi:4-amino-4-deoxy-L-arabinose transferase-like glycosyltransferase
MALAIRLTVMVFLYDDVLRPGRAPNWNFGYEQGRIASSIAQGKGFSNPLGDETGPTAWHPPVYPYSLAAIFKLFGIFTRSSAIAAVGLNCLFSALTCIPLFYFTLRSFGRQAAVVAGSFWVIFPYSVYWSIERVWDTWLTTLLLSILFLVVLRLESSDRRLEWAGFGLLAGFTALSNPATLSVMPALGVWLIWRLRRNGKRWLIPVGVSVLCAAGMVAPWVLRNYMVFGRFIPIRDSLGFEFAVGNDGDYKREYDICNGPWKLCTRGSDPEWARFQAVGEIAYFGEKTQQARTYILNHRGEYALATLRRVADLWTDCWNISPGYIRRDPLAPIVWILCTILSGFTLFGLWLAWRADAWSAWPYAAVLLFYPIVYYLTHTASWYRRPIDPFFVALTAYAWVTLYQEHRARERRPAMAAQPQFVLLAEESAQGE